MTPAEYLTAHSLDKDFLTKSFGVVIDEEKITIPVYDQEGKLMYCKYRHLTGDAKFTFDKGGKATLFCSHKITKHSNVVLCEGEPDCMRLWQEGIATVTATAGVATFSPKIAEPLKNKTVYLCLDTDEAGQAEVEKYCEILESVGAKVKIVSLPPMFKDVAEYFSSGNTKKDFVNLMREATDLDTWLISNTPESYKIESAKELLEAHIPTEKWLMDRVLPYEGFCFIAGPEACGKSFYTLGIAQSIAYGQPWLGQFKPIETGSVLFIDKENTRSRIQKRLKGLGYEDPDQMIWRIKYPEYFELTDEKGEFTPFTKAVLRHVRSHKTKLIIVDSFTDVMIGNENARDDTQAFFDSFRQLFPGLSILVLHHISKPQAGSSKSGGQLFRGSTNINAQIYSGFLVSPVPKTINEFTIEQVKAGDAPKLQKFKINLVSQVDPTNTNDSYVSQVKWEGVVEDEDAKGMAVVDIIKELLDQQDEISRQDIERVCLEKSIAPRTIQRAIAGMKEAGTLDWRKEGRKHIYFRPEIGKSDGRYQNDENDENDDY